MARFPKFDFDKFEREKLGPTHTLDGLGALGDNVVDFEKYLHSLNEAERIEFEERAAIMEFDGNIPKQSAEREALTNVINMRNYRNDRK